MSINTAHANEGVLIHAGEYILLFSDNVHMEFSGQDSPLFKGSKNGRIYLTTHRMIFNSKSQSEPMQSFSFPFVTITDVELEQPVFGANYIKGKVRAQPNGNFTGEAKFKLYFKSGGAIDFGQAMLRAAGMAQRNMHSDAPPPYTPPSGAWYEAPQPAYQPPPGYYGWLPTNDAFSGPPPPNSVFMSDNPPPYPGIGSPQPNGAPNSGYPGYPGGNVPPQQGYHPGQAYPGPPQQPYPDAPQQGYPDPAQLGYRGQRGNEHPQAGFVGYPGGTAPPQSNGYPGYPAGGPTSGGNFGYPSAPQSAGGFSGYPGGGPPSGYSGPQPSAGHPGGAAQFAAGNFGPNPSGGAMGFSAPPNSKEAEAAQSAYYDPSRPQTAYVPPPAYYEPPPSYNAVSKKDQ